jgi:hypothetical protein
VTSTAMQIKNKPKVNQIENDKTKIDNLLKEVSRLKQELENFRSKEISYPCSIEQSKIQNENIIEEQNLLNRKTVPFKQIRSVLNP